ncbi:hypothetical protein MSG28_006934 [Choristoneura fumiferana]|uniref:Uncharacterized protein n=1 Tax=Choristoneura fumiferana TaxID=7141 RepID=A0ACC0JLN9_CHOFU|nr:hypothetical protein MSG28_006934 [Choristoneura fumiferana]
MDQRKRTEKTKITLRKTIIAKKNAPQEAWQKTLRIAAGLRLGVGICESNNCVSCGAPVDRLGQHGLSCSSGAGRLSRHATLNDILRRALVSANVPAAL